MLETTKCLKYKKMKEREEGKREGGKKEEEGGRKKKRWNEWSEEKKEGKRAWKVREQEGRGREERKEITEPGAQPFSRQRKLRQGFDGGLISALLSVSASLEWPLFMVIAILPARLLPLRRVWALKVSEVRQAPQWPEFTPSEQTGPEAASHLRWPWLMLSSLRCSEDWVGGPSQHPCDRKTRCVLVSPVSQVLWEDGSWGRNARPSSLPALGVACHISGRQSQLSVRRQSGGAASGHHDFQVVFLLEAEKEQIQDSPGHWCSTASGGRDERGARDGRERNLFLVLLPKGIISLWREHL